MVCLYQLLECRGIQIQRIFRKTWVIRHIYLVHHILQSLHHVIQIASQDYCGGVPTLCGGDFIRLCNQLIKYRCGFSVRQLGIHPNFFVHVFRSSSQRQRTRQNRIDLLRCLFLGPFDHGAVPVTLYRQELSILRRGTRKSHIPLIQFSQIVGT